MKKMVVALSQQRSSQPQEDPPLDILSQRKSSVASTEVHVEHALLEDAPAPHYPVDDVTEMTQCELHQAMNNLSLKVAVGTALPCPPGALHHSLPIPPGYARVSVDDLVEGYEDLEIDIATPEGDKKLGDVKRHIILWPKKYIKFPGSAPRPPTPRINSPPPPEDRQPPMSTHMPDDRQPSMSTSPSPPPRDTTSLNKRKVVVPPRPLFQKKRNTAKIVDMPPPLPKRSYDKTNEELEADVAAYTKAFFAPKKPEPKQVHDEKTKKWAKSFLEQPSQISMNQKSDYDREIIKQASVKSKQNKGRSAKRGKQIPQLGQQKNQSVPPLIVTSSDVDKDFRADMDKDMQLLDPRAMTAAKGMGITVAQAKENATAAGISLGQYLGYEETPVGDIARNYVKGQPLVTKDEYTRLSTHMRNLHDWYMLQASKKDPKQWFSAAIRIEHHFKDYSIQIKMDELFKLYNQRALDKSIVGCYCL